MLGRPLGGLRRREYHLLPAQKAGEASLAAMIAGVLAMGNRNKMAAPVAAQKMGEASLTAVDTGPPP